MGINQFYTVFDNSPAGRSQSDCAPNTVFAHLNLAACRDFRSIWWHIQPSEYLSSYGPHGEGGVSWRQPPIAIKYSLEPNLVRVTITVPLLPQRGWLRLAGTI
jgi:hypothetical protein